MKSFLIFFIFVCAFSRHPLSAFDPQFKALSQSFSSNDTSHAFSIAMKIFVSVQTLYQELQLKQPLFLTSTPNKCQDLLSEIKDLSADPEWVDNFQEIYARLKSLSSKCTNMDFIGNSTRKASTVSGGFENKCVLCVILTKILENYISIHKKDVTDFIEKQFCDFFDGIIRPTCEAFVHFAGPAIINSILKKQNADVACLAVGLCKNPQCRMVSGWIEKQNLHAHGDNKPAPWDWLVHIFVDKFGNGHLPPFDLDNDTFSDISTFRGYNWRGADCNEMNKFVYPGRKQGSDLLDHDCNGVFGFNVKKGKSYEKQFCSESKRLGIAVIGDSAGAHFSIPERYFNASMIHKGTYNDFLPRVANELDIPHESGYTGNTNTNGYVRHSVYKYLREWNLCNNNDYQNTAVNGGASGNTQDNIKALKRDQNNDHPLLMFMELIGNDVCKDSFNRMTTTTQFKENILKLLNYLDDNVPKGSHLMILGLAEGEMLYDNLHDWIHPLNVTYSDVYDFLNCLKISPCWGWLNSNETVRKFTTQRARNLSQVYQEIIDDGTTFQNFDMVYYEFPTFEILNRKIMQGGDPKDMIERADGFHPNGQFHSYLADWLWRKIQDNHLDWIGQKNPHNDQIRKVFNIKVVK